ncbi:unnamed protein product [Oikopleura dioica]|uniref:UBA domain-containing protein n=1 Tax=Oikopleura dioica TaxID=34765 RepID=E4XQF4_OIKDI|nr:unnamed protein product [Oikopleura dioica]
MRIYSSLTKHIFNQSENPVDDFNLQFGKIVSSLMDDDPRNWTSKQCSSLNLKMICHKLQMQLTDIDQVLDPVQLVSFLLKLISTELNPSPADKFAAELDTFTKCILSDAEAMNTTNSSVVEIQAGESISKALEDWATFTEHNFFSPQLRERSPAQIRRRFRSFPSKLLISCPRYFKDTEWVVKEVAQKLIVEDELDLSWLKSDGEIFQPTMELGEESENGPVCDEIRMLFEMGFSQKLARKALDRASWDVEGAAEWLLMNPEQEIPSANHEISAKPSSATFSIENYEGELASEENPVFAKITLTRETRQFTEEEFEKRQREYTEFVFDPESVALLESFGIPTGLAKKALRICKGEIERSADWAFNNWDSPIYEDDLEEPLVTEESVTAQAKKVKDELNSLQREGQELMRQMAKEKRNPTTDFVTEMVDRLEGRKAASQSAIPRAIRPKKKLETPNEALAASASPTTQAMLELMDDLEIQPPLPKQENQILEIKEENAISNPEYYRLDLDLTDQSTIHDVLVNENGCMEDTTDCNTTDYDTDYIVIDNLTDYHEQELTDSRSDEAIPLEELELLERPASESDRLSLIDELINESVQQIDKQIEENTASSFENLKMSEDLRRSPSPPQIVDPLSVISEENSQLPTDFCTSPENSLKSECDDSQPTMTLSSVIKGQSISELGQEITKSSCTPSMETVLTPAVPEKKKKKKIIKKIVKKKVKRSTKENQNENANNSVENAKYSLVSFISRTDGTPMLPHFSYFEKSGENEWLVFDDGNVGICSEDRVAEAKSTAVLFLYDRLNEI